MKGRDGKWKKRRGNEKRGTGKSAVTPPPEIFELPLQLAQILTCLRACLFRTLCLSFFALLHFITTRLITDRCHAYLRHSDSWVTLRHSDNMFLTTTTTAETTAENEHTSAEHALLYWGLGQSKGILNIARPRYAKQLSPTQQRKARFPALRTQRKVYAINAKSKTRHSRETEHVLIWRKPFSRDKFHVIGHFLLRALREAGNRASRAQGRFTLTRTFAANTRNVANVCGRSRYVFRHCNPGMRDQILGFRD